MKYSSLVVLRHDFDDLPIRLFTNAGPDDLAAQEFTHELAKKFAQTVEEGDGGNVKKLLSIDSSTPNCVWVYSFADGVMTAAEMVKEF